jgi:hypothetical protein
MLKRSGVKHVVLNAKYHAKEAEIVAQAGRKGSVTIATNMAGRGTDIVLGGNEDFLARDLLRKQNVEPDEATPEQMEAAREKVRPEIEAERREVLDLGGLHIMGTERHEARRIDNQLRGRSGRQGDARNRLHPRALRGALHSGVQRRGFGAYDRRCVTDTRQSARASALERGTQEGRLTVTSSAGWGPEWPCARPAH